MAPPPLPDDIDPFDLLDGEQTRLDDFFGTLDAAGWEQPTACAGWRRREMVAHLAGNEVYNRACLDDRVGELLAKAGEAQVTDVDSFNAWQIRLREDRGVDEVLAEWRDAAPGVRAELRSRGRDGTLPTMVGPYPAGAQAFHLAFEAAIHGDDMGIPVAPETAPQRSAWMARFCVFALGEEDRPVDAERAAGGVRVRHRDTGDEAVIGDAELVTLFAGRQRMESLPQALSDALTMYG